MEAKEADFSSLRFKVEALLSRLFFDVLFSGGEGPRKSRKEISDMNSVILTGHLGNAPTSEARAAPPTRASVSRSAPAIRRRTASGPSAPTGSRSSPSMGSRRASPTSARATCSAAAAACGPIPGRRTASPARRSRSWRRASSSCVSRRIGRRRSRSGPQGGGGASRLQAHLLGGGLSRSRGGAWTRVNRRERGGEGCLARGSPAPALLEGNTSCFCSFAEAAR
jgi:hypothetical protein